MTALYAMPGNASFAALLAKHGNLPRHELHVHPFPDGETLVRVPTPLAHDDAVIVPIPSWCRC
jgi:ribose-phosphate pyrophosphokinase